VQIAHIQGPKELECPGGAIIVRHDGKLLHHRCRTRSPIEQIQIRLAIPLSVPGAVFPRAGTDRSIRSQDHSVACSGSKPTLRAKGR
jgi:hypothetical protein